MIHRIHILGAFGSGTTTLGRALAERLPCPHFETDGYCWVPTDPPYTTQRERTERQQLLLDDVTVHDSWVVSGSLCGWGDEGSGQNDVHAEHRRALCAQTDGSNHARYRRRAYAYPKASG